MEYFIFIADIFENNIKGLNNHLKYLQKWGGTPDFFDSYKDLVTAIEDGKKMINSGKELIVITNEEYDIIVMLKNKENEN